ncbi:MAG: S46 family peptidase [Limisphaerales bacterium]
MSKELPASLRPRPQANLRTPLAAAFCPGGTCLLLAMLAVCVPSHADEGMWLYNHPPREAIRDKYGFELTDAWLKNLQLCSVRFGGASGEFVSEEGLILSNHHVGSRALQRLSTKEHNYLRDGFYARTRQEEQPCPGLEVSVLEEIEDVTARVNAAVQPGLADEEAFRARRAIIAAIEKESQDKTGLRSEVVTLYQGAEYHLYRYKRYTDIRLVFAPEEQTAFYGGDPDNFEYPRFDLDICLFRAYEKGQPAKVEHYLKWSRNGPADRELVFVSGHPGRTDRLRTVGELEYLRDWEYPRTLQRLNRLEVLYGAYSARSAENTRRARNDLFGVRNSRKAREGALAGLLDAKLMEARRASEEKLRASVRTLVENGKLGAGASPAQVEQAWERIVQAQQAIAQRAVEYELLEQGAGFNSVLFRYARSLLRSAVERSKPDGVRLEEYQEAGRASFEHELFAENPVYEDLETLKLTDSLTSLAGDGRYNQPVVHKVLSGLSPHERAFAAVHGTKLASPATRRQWYEGGLQALAEAHDPMIELARQVDDEARAVRKEVEARREAIRQAHAQIGKARYALEGANQYPDATGTLRLSYGVVAGYEEDGQHVPFQTTLAGLYQRAAGQNYRPPFDLPERWLANEKKLNPATPFDFVCTADIIGGNSGSPLVNRRGEFVGIIFDGNIQSLVADFLYTEEQARAVCVHSAAIIEALENLYDAKPLAEELLGRRE